MAKYLKARVGVSRLYTHTHRDGVMTNKICYSLHINIHICVYRVWKVGGGQNVPGYNMVYDTRYSLAQLRYGGWRAG